MQPLNSLEGHKQVPLVSFWPLHSMFSHASQAEVQRAEAWKKEIYTVALYQKEIYTVEQDSKVSCVAAWYLCHNISDKAQAVREKNLTISMELISCNVHTCVPYIALKPKLWFYRWDHHQQDSKIHSLLQRWQSNWTVHHWRIYRQENPVVCVCNALDGSVALSATCCPCQVCVQGAGQIKGQGSFQSLWETVLSPHTTVLVALA